jgi:2-methylcitrate dehydratase PrpD
VLDQKGVLTAKIARFAVELEFDQLPPEARATVRATLLDTLGCAIAGLDSPAGRIAVAHCRHERGSLEATLVGAGPASVTSAAFGNALLANAIDSDAFGPEGHMAAVVVPAALAVAEAMDSSGAALSTAIACGLEIGGRLGGAMRAMAKSAQPLTGHTFAGIGAAIAAGRLLGLSEDQMLNAIGIAGYSAQVPTLRRFFSRNQDAMTKYDHLGLAARNGVDAAVLAWRGFTGDRAILDGDYAFWRLSGAEGFDEDLFAGDLGWAWRMRRMQFKAYPVGIGTVPMIDCLKEAQAASGAGVAGIRRIEVRSATAYVHKESKITSVIEAWLDLRYALAMALLDVQPARAWFTPQQFERTDVAELMEKISIAPLPDPPGRWAVEVCVHTMDGGVFTAARDDLDPMDEAAIAAKFKDNVLGLLPDAAAARLVDLCAGLEALESVRAIGAVLEAVHD